MDRPGGMVRQKSAMALGALLASFTGCRSTKLKRTGINRVRREPRGRFEALERRYLLDGDYFWFAVSPLSVGISPQSVALADVNQDGILDLITAHDALSQVRVCIGNGDGSFGDSVDYDVGGQAYGLVVHDLNGDGSLDILVSLRFEDRLALLWGHGDGTFSLGDPIPTGDYPTGIAVADFNADGQPDIVTADYNGGTLSVILAGEGGDFLPAVGYVSGDAPFAVAAADINADGKLDLVAVNAYSRTLAIFSGRGDGTFGHATTIDLGVFPYDVAVGDINGDSALDVVVSNTGDNNIRVFLNDGTGGLTLGGVLSTKAYPGPLALMDVNHDGYLDIVVACSNSDVVQIFLGVGNGSFNLWREISVGPYPTDFAFGDINGDGRVDFVTANYDGNSVSVLLQELDTQPPTSWFTSVPSEAWGLPVNVSWAGNDQSGSGVAGYHVWYRRQGENAYTLWLAHTSQTSGTFMAEPGYIYELVVTAYDNAGNLEPIPDSPKATITLKTQPVDFLVLTNIAAGETLYPIKTTQGGLLTIVASGLDRTAGQQIELYDAGKALIATSTTQGRQERIDHPSTTADELYYIKIVGENAAATLTLVNLITIAGEQVTISGSPQTDWLVIDAQARTFAINGVNYAWPEGNSIQIEAHGRGNGDWAQLYDSLGDDIFIAKPGESRLEGPGYQIAIYNFFAVHGYSKTGSGNDTAQLFGTPGDEVVCGTSDYQLIRGDNFVVRSKFFAEAAINSGGGKDRVKLLGSNEADHISMTPEAIEFRVQNRLIKTNITADIFIFGSMGNDTATLDTGNHLVALDARVERLRLLAADVGYILRITGFETVTAKNQNSASTKRLNLAVDYLMLEGTWA